MRTANAPKTYLTMNVLLAALGLAACVETDDGLEGCPPEQAVAGADGEPACEPTPAEDRAPAAALDHGPTLPTDRVGHPPVAVADADETAEDVPLVLAFDTLLANDGDPDGDPIFVAGLGAAVGGTAVLRRDGVAFLPAPDFHGVAGFEYRLSDGRMHAVGRVAVAVAPVNDAPRAGDARLVLPAGEAAVFRLKGDDVDGDLLTAELLEKPTQGSLDVASGKYVFQPAAGWSGRDRLVYRVHDGALWSPPATLWFVDADLAGTPGT
jgi:hypothetical protein